MDEKINILMIAVDSLRADHLGCYGYHHPTSPRIDALAEDGVLFNNFFCPSIPAQPSYTTLYTGQHPITHGIVAEGGKALLEKTAPFFVQMLLQSGYTTCAVDYLQRERPWFVRGYEYYINPGVRRAFAQGVPCEELNRRAIPWIEAHTGEPFFLFLHYWDLHHPLTPPERYQKLFYQGANPTDPENRSMDDYWKHPLGAEARDTWLRTSEGLITDADYVTALYDQEIKHMDDGVGEVLAALDELGIAERTLVILVSDHGESLTDHGIFFEHHGLYDSTIRVPMIARLPGRFPKGAKQPGLFQMQDIAPTLLEATGITIPPAMDGQSLWRVLTGEDNEGGHKQVVSAECSWQAKWSLRTEEHKLILAREPDFYGNPSRELYELKADPSEEKNIAEEKPDLADSMEAQLEGWISDRLKAMDKDDDPLRKESLTLGAALASQT